MYQSRLKGNKITFNFCIQKDFPTKWRNDPDRVQ